MDHQSLWDCLAEFPVRAPLDGDRQADVLVIGAGLTGLLCAHRLKAQGLHCIVIDAERTCSGVTAYTTGKITQQHGLVYGPLIQNFGEEKARQYLRANLDAIQAYKQLIVGQEIACDFEAKPNVVYTLAHPERIEQELAALQRLGMPGELIQEADLPFSIRCGLRTHYSYQFNPLAFAAHIAKDLEIYENTRALHIDGNTVKTPHGVIRAEKIIVATHYPIKDMPGFYFARMSQNRSYLAAVKKAWIPDAMYVDEANQGMTFRSYRDYLIVGGMGHRSGGVGVDLYEKLEEKIDGMFPGSRMQFLWSAQDCMPMDGVPYIGQYAPTTPHLYVAGGFQKWGMSTAMAAAMILEDLVQGRDNPCAAVFSPRRFSYKASRAKLLKNTRTFVSGFTRQHFTRCDAGMESVHRGEAKIVEVDGQKKGVYVDGGGHYHMVDAKCPHLGCQLEWNAAELSWDCPCHGSQFDFDGHVITNPANVPAVN